MEVEGEAVVHVNKVGGMGLGCIKSLNISLLAKWTWRLKTEDFALWARIIRCIHKLDGRHWSVLTNKSNKGVLMNITKSRSYLERSNIDIKEIISWNSNDDRWESEFTVEGCFIVCKLRERIELAGFIINDGPFDWGKTTPFKILAFVLVKHPRLTNLWCVSCDHPELFPQLPEVPETKTENRKHEA
uniref:RNA-directed DNA polymerase, eukaryota, reverse transcriptase zinc-binding domain protein n=1 Tax=Lactuca sativa TaxID=4236 RepID=A0A9R1VIP6_LACSA|nr:hypothetical protein LSAT_V11C500256100 [Lactuca sativa]